MIFITGFHHSGTSILARTVERLGFEFGEPLDRHHENELLKSIDDLLIGDWQSPTIPSQKIVDGCIDMASEMASGVEAYKNPRMMFTAPFWHELFSEDFPPPIWIVIRRAQSDVTKSMMLDETRAQNPWYWNRMQAAYAVAFRTFVRDSQPNLHAIDYRTMCEHPRKTVRELAEAIGRFGTEVDPAAVKKTSDWAKKTYKFKTYA